jgi:hypothetical protein
VALISGRFDRVDTKPGNNSARITEMSENFMPITHAYRPGVDVDELVMDPVVASACKAMDVLTDECSNDVEILEPGTDRHRNTSGVVRAGGEKAASGTEEMPFSPTTDASAGRARLSQRDCLLDRVFYVFRKIGFGLPIDCQTTVSL